MDLTPQITVILPAMLGAESITCAIEAWLAQTRCDALEILVLVPSLPAHVSLEPKLRFLVIGDSLLHEARLLGIAAARTEYLIIAEDHCLPEPDWTAHMLARLSEGHRMLGPALRSGNPQTAICLASFLIGYGEWTEPVPGGAVTVLPGHNILLHRSLLESLQPTLPDLMIVCSMMVKALRAKGQAFYLEPAARMRHYDIPSWWKTFGIFAMVGTNFGAQRTRSWFPGLRFLYWLACPLIAGLHLRRGLYHWWRTARTSWTVPFPMICLGVIWGVSEGIGAVLGPRQVVRWVGACEIKPVSAQTVREAERYR